MKVLLVGGGITSAVTSMFFRKKFPDCNLSLWDKSKGSGGRMTTSKCPANTNCTADIGAQYITTGEDVIKSNQDIYNDLFHESILEPLSCKFVGYKTRGDSKDFVVPSGSGSLVKHFIQKANLDEIKFSYHVQSISKENDKWLVETKTGEKEHFNTVVLTMPVPQIFLLDGTIQSEFDNELVSNLKSVTYSSRYVLVMYFVDSLKEDWGAQFIDNHQVFRYVAIDNVKRNQPSNPCAVVFHTSIDFGIKHVEDSISDIEPLLLSQAKLLFPNWPDPTSVKCHKWRYSQVLNPFKDTPGCVVISTNPPLLIGGDSFTGSGFDNCVKSSRVMCEKLEKILNVQSQL